MNHNPKLLAWAVIFPREKLLSFCFHPLRHHPVLIKIHEMHLGFNPRQETVFRCVVGHLGISGHLAADNSAKDALDSSISESMSCDLKPRLDSSVTELTKREWDEHYPWNLNS